MSREHKSALRMIAVVVLLVGGYSTSMLIHNLQGWPSVIVPAVATAAMIYASGLLIEEGRERERAERERRPPEQ